MICCVVWQSFGSDRFSQSIPLQLFIVYEVPPLLESTLMNGQLNLLSSCTGKDWPGFSLNIAFTINMEKSNIAD